MSPCVQLLQSCESAWRQIHGIGLFFFRCPLWTARLAVDLSVTSKSRWVDIRSISSTHRRSISSTVGDHSMLLYLKVWSDLELVSSVHRAKCWDTRLSRTIQLNTILVYNYKYHYSNGMNELKVKCGMYSTHNLNRKRVKCIIEVWCKPTTASQPKKSQSLCCVDPQNLKPIAQIEQEKVAPEMRVDLHHTSKLNSYKAMYNFMMLQLRTLWTGWMQVGWNAFHGTHTYLAREVATRLVVA